MKRFVVIALAGVSFLIFYGNCVQKNARQFETESYSVYDIDPVIANDSGKILYIKYCASCHSFDHELIAPPLNSFKEIRSVDWLYLFLTKREQIVKDSLYLANLQKYKAVCKEFPELTRREVDLIWLNKK